MTGKQETTVAIGSVKERRIAILRSMRPRQVK
jgi:hypothetical protein